MPRRNKSGEGSFETLASGKIRFRKTITLRNGKQKRLSSKAREDTRKGRKEARQEVDKLEEQYSKYGESITLKEFYYDEYVPQQILLGNIKESTKSKTYDTAFKKRILPILGSKKLTELKKKDIQTDFVNVLAKQETLRTKKPLSPKSIRNIVHALSACLEYAKYLEYIPENPAKGLKLPKKSKSEEEQMEYDEDFLNDEELIDFLKEIQIPGKYRTKNVILLLLYTGCRPGEILGLTWNHVKPDCLQIRQTLQEPRGKNSEPYLGTVKTEKGNRDLPRTANINLILEEQREEQKRSKKHFITELYLPWQPKFNLVFTQQDGSPLTAKMVYDDVEKAGTAIGLRYSNGKPKHIHPYTFRHTFITQILNHGIMPLEELSEYVGHKNTKTTLDNYRRGSRARIINNGAGVNDFFESMNQTTKAESKAESDG